MLEQDLSEARPANWADKRFNPEIYNRTPRVQDEPVEGKIQIPAPPQPERDPVRGLLTILLPFAAPLLTSLFYAAISSATGRSGMYALPMMGMAVMSAIVSLLIYSQQRWSQRQKELEAKLEYHDLLDRKTARLQAARELQIYIQQRNHPAPPALKSVVAELTPLVWGRSPGDFDFAELRIGMGDVPSSVSIEGPDPDLNSRELRRALRIVYKYRHIDHGILSINLLRHGSIAVIGDRKTIRLHAYALLAQLVVHHAPGDVDLYIVSSGEGQPHWEWARWLPHTNSEGVGGIPTFIAYEHADAKRLMSVVTQRFEDSPKEGETPSKCIVVVFDEPTRWLTEDDFSKIVSGYRRGVVAICLGETERDVSPDCNVVIKIVDGLNLQIAFAGQTGQKLAGRADEMRLADIESLARQLAALRLPTIANFSRLPTNLNFLQLYGQDLIETLQISHRWNRIPAKGALPFAVPIGNIDIANQQYLHLADNVDGPHGMIAGTTGAGKSELLRTLVMALALEHHPYFLNFMLIDFKGGSMSRVFEKLPHSVGSLSNIDGDNPAQARSEALRVLKAIKSENLHRQQFLKTQSNNYQTDIPDITAYHNLLLTKRHSKIPLEWTPMPHLIIIIDEFAELATELPDFLPEMVSVARVGRSLGMHLILAMQRPGGHVKEEIRANLQFRICLRVQTPEDSRDMLGRSDAAFLPTNVPGRAYFQSGQSGLVQFQAARIDIPYNQDNEADDESIIRFHVRGEHIEEYKIKERATKPVALKLQDMLITALIKEFERSGARHPQPILLPSLQPTLTLGEVFASAQRRGWDGKQWIASGDDFDMLCAPIGLVDNVAERSCPPLVLNFNDHGGAVIVGSPSSGKSTACQSLILSLVYLYPPDHVELYIIGRGFGRFQHFPHIGAVILAEETERVRRLGLMIRGMIHERDRLFQEAGALSFEEYTAICRRPSVQHGKPLTSVVVIIDNFAHLMENGFERSDFVQLVRDGRQYGIYFVLTGNTVTAHDLPSPFLDLNEQRIALNLPEKSDVSAIVGRIEDYNMAVRPGAGMARTADRPLPVQIALPNVAPQSGENVQQSTFEDEGKAMAACLEKQNIVRGAREILTLPTDIPFDIPALHTSELGKVNKHLQGLIRRVGSERPSGTKIVVPVGIDFDSQDVCMLDLNIEGPHFLVGGPVESGKTTVLRTIAFSASYYYTPDETQIIWIDVNAPSANAMRDLTRIELCTTADEIKARVASLFEVVETRETLLKQGTSEETAAFTPILIFIDGYDSQVENVSFERSMDRNQPERSLSSLVSKIARQKQLGIYLFVSVSVNAQLSQDVGYKALKNRRMAIGLVSYDVCEALTGTTWEISSDLKRSMLPTGRGYLLIRGQKARVVQFARVHNEKAFVTSILEK